MNVPNYMPEPIEVPGNVTTEKYALRLVFIRKVIWMHLASLGLVAAATAIPMPYRGVGPTALTLALFLILLELVRIRTRGRREEPLLSCVLFPPVIVLAAALLRESYHLGYPVWALIVGPVCAGLYSAICGRDFSFVGCYFLSLIASSIFVASIAISIGLSGPMAGLAIAFNAIYLFYWVYDLAALLARRRLREEAAAVVDLYRDVFNIFGYIPRVASHWKKHKIWVAPTQTARQREDRA
jgi:hypothetical protein